MLGGAIITKVQSDLITKLNFKIDISVCEFYSSNSWCTFTKDSADHSVRSICQWLQCLAAIILNQITLCTLAKDAAIWLPSPTGQLTTKSAWEATRVRSFKVPWRDLIWFKGVIPYFSFTAWLITLDKLSTIDRFCRISVATIAACPFCQASGETLAHLFFLWSYSQEVWKLTIARKTNIPPQLWNMLLNLLLQNPIGPLASKEFKLLFTTTAYYLWLEWNFRTFESTTLPPGALANRIHSALWA